jgi:hypothetical protein
MKRGLIEAQLTYRSRLVVTHTGPSINPRIGFHVNLMNLELFGRLGRLQAAPKRYTQYYIVKL